MVRTQIQLTEQQARAYRLSNMYPKGIGKMTTEDPPADLDWDIINLGGSRSTTLSELIELLDQRLLGVDVVAEGGARDGRRAAGQGLDRQTMSGTMPSCS